MICVQKVLKADIYKTLGRYDQLIGPVECANRFRVCKKQNDLFSVFSQRKCPNEIPHLLPSEGQVLSLMDMY